MDESNQIEPPPSFAALYAAPGGQRLLKPASFVVARYEFCEDLAQSLVSHAGAMLAKTDGAEREALAQIRQALRADADLLSEPETDWVLARLAELAGWDAGT